MFTRAELDADKLYSKFACPVDLVAAFTTSALMLPPLTTHNVHIVDLTRVVLAKSNHTCYGRCLQVESPSKVHSRTGLKVSSVSHNSRMSFNMSAKVEHDPSAAQISGRPDDNRGWLFITMLLGPS